MSLKQNSWVNFDTSLSDFLLKFWNHSDTDYIDKVFIFHAKSYINCFMTTQCCTWQKEIVHVVKQEWLNL